MPERKIFRVYGGECKKSVGVVEYKTGYYLVGYQYAGNGRIGIVPAYTKSYILPNHFLTARVTEQDVIKGLSVGGDDYITKPFSMDELLARISAHLRREERKSAASNLRFDEELIIDYNSHTVFYGETLLEFSNKEFEIIRLLSQNAGMVYDRETIYEKLWGYDGEGDSIVVKEHIRKIRNKLSAYTDKNYIETVWGVGYRWAK